MIEQDERLKGVYTRSDGLCIRHLRIGLGNFMDKFPTVGDFLIRDTMKRLEAQQIHMLEYIRKNNWAYRNEAITSDELSAWLRTLTFFTGYPAERFDHRIDKF
jgi:hypothetical protein